MNSILFSNVIEECLRISYDFKITANKRRGNERFLFDPMSHKQGWRSLCSGFVISIMSLLVFLFAPLFKKFNGLWVSGSDSSAVCFQCSDKSSSLQSILFEENKSCCLVSTVRIVGKFWTCGAKGYIIYLRSVLIFIRLFGTQFWFYPSILQLPNLINLILILERLSPDKVIFSNHYDRWVPVILDYCSRNSAKSILVQHGIEDTTSVFPMRKFATLSTLYCYDFGQSRMFVDNIYSFINEIRFFAPRISLAPVAVNLQSVLVVGHGNSVVFEEELKAIKYLLQFSEFFVFVKPHPLSRNYLSYKSITSGRFKVICNPSFFPDVDLLLHSGSTLALEYQLSSIKVKIFELKDYMRCINH